MSDSVSVTCPHCGSSLQIDSEAGVVVSHSPPVDTREKTDFETRLKQMEEEKKRSSDKMAEAMRKEKSRDRIMEDKFRQLMDEAKKLDPNEKPIKDIDLD